MSSDRIDHIRHMLRKILFIGIFTLCAILYIFGSEWSSVSSRALNQTLPPNPSIKFAAGWNFVSIPLQPADNTLETVLGPIDGSYTIARHYDGCDSTNPWKTYDPKAPAYANDFTTVDETQSFWIHLSAAAEMSLFGTEPLTTEIELCAGWNMVGYPLLESQPPADVFDGCPVTIVRAFDANDSANPWKTYDPAAPDYANDLQEMRSGLGYWVRVSSDCTWIMQSE